MEGPAMRTSVELSEGVVKRHGSARQQLADTHVDTGRMDDLMIVCTVDFCTVDRMIHMSVL